MAGHQKGELTTLTFNGTSIELLTVDGLDGFTQAKVKDYALGDEVKKTRPSKQWEPGDLKVTGFVGAGSAALKATKGDGKSDHKIVVTVTDGTTPVSYAFDGYVTDYSETGMEEDSNVTFSATIASNGESSGGT
jgi:hypothetical protein